MVVFVVFVSPVPVRLPLFIGSVTPSDERPTRRRPVQTPIPVLITVPTMIIMVLAIPVTMVPHIVMLIGSGKDGQ